VSKKREVLKLFHGLLAVSNQPDTARLIDIVGLYLTNKILLDECLAQLEAYSKKVDAQEAVN
jgi:hypothetical protein